jgi:hypothetical protein
VVTNGPALVRFDIGQIKRGSQPSLAALIKHRVAGRCQNIRVRYEIGKAPVEWDGTAPWNQAVWLTFGTLIEITEPAEIGIASRSKQKYIYLMAGDARTDAGLMRGLQGANTGPAQFAQTVLRVDPQRQIEIAAFMPDLDALSAIRAEAWDLLPQPLGHGADHRNGHHLRKSHPGIRYDVRRDPKLALLLQKVVVLLLDLGPPHDPLIPTAA